ncbi:MAG: response regulator [Kribbellaceae bacterium]|jgi:DNA-binding NarL/FixJ family response regulator
MIRVLIADDQGMVRAGLRSLLENEVGISVVAEAANGEDAVAAVRRTRPDVVLMDIRMPELNGIEATRRLVAEQTPARVLMLTTFDLDEYLFDALRAGASGFLLKDAPAEDLVAAVRVLADGDALLAPAVTRRVIESFARFPIVDPPQILATLSPREREVLTLLARGHSNAEIAGNLHVSEATAKTHVSSILSKLRLRDRVQAVIFAYESALVRPGD